MPYACQETAAELFFEGPETVHVRIHLDAESKVDKVLQPDAVKRSIILQDLLENRSVQQALLLPLSGNAMLAWINHIDAELLKSNLTSTSFERMVSAVDIEHSCLLLTVRYLSSA